MAESAVPHSASMASVLWLTGSDNCRYLQGIANRSPSWKREKPCDAYWLNPTQCVACQCARGI